MTELDLYVFSTPGFSTRGLKNHDAPDDRSADFKYETVAYHMTSLAINDILILQGLKENNPVKSIAVSVKGSTGAIPNECIPPWDQPSIIHDDYCFSYGLFYGNPNEGLISKAHRAYGVITENQSKWMERLFHDIGSKYSTIKLSDLIMPGSHDSGMYLRNLPAPFQQFANTQKDPIENQLALGARIFDFRAGQIYDSTSGCLIYEDIPEFLKPLLVLMGITSKTEFDTICCLYPGIRHIHSFVPGETYEKFVEGIVKFLKENTKEIVIIYFSTDGFLHHVKRATKNELDAITNSAISSYYPELKTGDKSCLKKSVKSLIEANQRLILIGDGKVPGFEDSVKLKSSYTDEAYQSLNSQNVINAISKLNETPREHDEWEGKDVIGMSLQLTGTATTAGITNIIQAFSLHDPYLAMSPLVATKAPTDKLTYEWILKGNIRSNNKGAMITVHNDYYDPGLTAIVAKVLRERIDRM